MKFHLGLPVTGKPEVHIYQCFHPEDRTVCPGHLAETVGERKKCSISRQYWSTHTKRHHVNYMLTTALLLYLLLPKIECHSNILLTVSMMKCPKHNGGY